jgi:hypothetical protein
MLSEPDVLILMYFVIPVWFAAGFADWLCHRSSNIETTSGIKEPQWRQSASGQFGCHLGFNAGSRGRHCQLGVERQCSRRTWGGEFCGYVLVLREL